MSDGSLNRVGNRCGMHGNHGHRPKSRVVLEAIAEGRKTYQGAPCKYGHSGDRLVSTNACRDCLRINARRRYHANPQQTKKSASAWSAANPDKRRAIVRIYAASRRALILNATPKWLTSEQILEMSKFWTQCPQGKHVDHIVPLKGKTVCGLHVPWNLQYLSSNENMSKGNRYWPDNWSTP